MLVGAGFKPARASSTSVGAGLKPARDRLEPVVEAGDEAAGEVEFAHGFLRHGDGVVDAPELQRPLIQIEDGYVKAFGVRNETGWRLARARSYPEDDSSSEQ